MTFTDWVAWAGLIVAFVSAAFTGLQWLSARRAAESSERSAGAAERSAAAAEDSAKSTRLLTQLAQRPWVALQPLDVTEVQSGNLDGTTITVQATLCNVGETPAVDARADSRLEQWVMPTGGSPTLQPLPERSVTVGPGVSLSLNRLSAFVENARAEEFRQGQRKLLLYGSCAYKDVFGESHQTRWCLEYVGNGSFAPLQREGNEMT